MLTYFYQQNVPRNNSVSKKECFIPHYRKEIFLNEYRKMLKLFDIDYDEQYIFKLI